MYIKQHISAIENADYLTVIRLGKLLLTGEVVEVIRPDGQRGYAPAPPLPCPECGGAGFLWDSEFELSGVCPECFGSGIEGGK